MGIHWGYFEKITVGVGSEVDRVKRPSPTATCSVLDKSIVSTMTELSAFCKGSLVTRFKGHCQT